MHCFNAVGLFFGDDGRLRVVHERVVFERNGARFPVQVLVLVGPDARVAVDGDFGGLVHFDRVSRVEDDLLDGAGYLHVGFGGAHC